MGEAGGEQKGRDTGKLGVRYIVVWAAGGTRDTLYSRAGRQKEEGKGGAGEEREENLVEKDL